MRSTKHLLLCRIFPLQYKAPVPLGPTPITLFPSTATRQNYSKQLSGCNPESSSLLSPTTTRARFTYTIYPLSSTPPRPLNLVPPEGRGTGTTTASAMSFYMRNLPTSADIIAYDSPEGKRIFKQALDEGGLEAFFPLSQQFLTQEEPAYCGIGTLCMILNALKIDPAKTWRRPWRWFTQEMLDCCRPLAYIRTNGITLSEFTCLARCNGLEATTKYADKMYEFCFLILLSEILKLICSFLARWRTSGRM